MDRRLLGLLRHRPPMLLLTSVVHVDTQRASALVRIGRESSFFSAPHGVPAWIGIEYMAQTVGLIAGEDARRDGGTAPTGYLLGTRRLESEVDWFAPGSELEVTAAEQYVDDNGLGAYDCAIASGGHRLSFCRLTVYRRPDNDVQTL